MVETVLTVLGFTALGLILGMVALGVSSATQANRIDRLSMADEEEEDNG
tara:strand:+ start:397 stop:543 length:147 start_codon:yes stop_codon:yes gene_type:complete